MITHLRKKNLPFIIHFIRSLHNNRKIIYNHARRKIFKSAILEPFDGVLKSSNDILFWLWTIIWNINNMACLYGFVLGRQNLPCDLTFDPWAMCHTIETIIGRHSKTKRLYIINIFIELVGVCFKKKFFFTFFMDNILLY